MTQPPQGPQVIYKPGGLSGGEHALHIILTLLTCGLWIIGYVYFATNAPKRKVEVIAPAGTDPAVLAQTHAAAQAQAAQLTPQEATTRNHTALLLLFLVGTPIVLCLVAMIAGQIQGK